MKRSFTGPFLAIALSLLWSDRARPQPRQDFYEDGLERLEEEIDRLSEDEEEEPILFDVDVSDWQVTDIEEGNFSIWMPAPPEEDEQLLQTEAGELALRLYRANPSGGTFVAAYGDYATLSDDPNAILQDISDRLLPERDRDTERAILLDRKYPGLEVTADASQGKVAYRLYLVDRRVYFLFVRLQGRQTSQRPATVFFESFQLLPEVRPPR